MPWKISTQMQQSIEIDLNTTPKKEIKPFKVGIIPSAGLDESYQTPIKEKAPPKVIGKKKSYYQKFLTGMIAAQSGKKIVPHKNTSIHLKWDPLSEREFKEINKP